MENIASEKYNYKKSKDYIQDLFKIMEKNKEEDFKLLPEKLDYLIQASKDLGLSFVYLLMALKPKNSHKNMALFLLELYIDEIEKQKIENLFTIIIDSFNYIGPKDYLISNPIEDKFLKNIQDCDIMENLSETKTRKECTVIENLYSRIVSTIDKYYTYIGKDERLENDLTEILSQYNECRKDIDNLKDNKSIPNIKFNIDFFNDLIDIIDFNKLYKKNSFNREDSWNINNNSNDLSLSLVLNNSFSSSFSQHLETIPLKDRIFFKINETLSYGEDIEIEFKNYYFKNCSLPNDLEKILKHSICGMLNNKGGRIFFGITDNKVVKGQQLNYNQRDQITLYLLNLTTKFYPNCKSSKISVHFIPIKDENQNFMNNLYVTKIIIKQGDTDKLYSVSNIDYESYMRLQGMVSHLKPEEIANEIHERKTKPKVSIPDDEFDDPKPEENLYESKIKKFEVYKVNDYFLELIAKENQNQRKENSEKDLIKIKIRNISEETPIDVLEAMFSEFNDILEKKLLFKIGECSAGYAYLFTKTKESAKKIIDTFDGKDVYGKKIQLFIKK